MTRRRLGQELGSQSIAELNPVLRGLPIHTYFRVTKLSRGNEAVDRGGYAAFRCRTLNVERRHRALHRDLERRNNGPAPAPVSVYAEMQSWRPMRAVPTGKLRTMAQSPGCTTNWG